jgi:hypothetical protein
MSNLLSNLKRAVFRVSARRARDLSRVALGSCLAVTSLLSGAAEPLYPVEPAHQKVDLPWLSQVGRGRHVPLPLKRVEDKRVERFETSFEECAPGRNSGANEWSAFGAVGNMDFNAMGRELWVRYPAFELEFRLQSSNSVIEPGQLPSFRLGLVNNRLPAIWGGWQHDGLCYKVSAMTVPSPQCGNFDLYKLEIQNPTARPAQSGLFVGVNGPPDMHFQDGVLRGLGENAFLIATPAVAHQLETREAGWCDKRAKAQCDCWTGNPGPAVRSFRFGFDGLPVVYRFKAEAGKKYVVCLAAPRGVSGYSVESPKRTGDLVFEYNVEGCTPKTLDCSEWTVQHAGPLWAEFDGAQDVDGDGAIEVRAGVAAASRIRQTRLSAIWVFPGGTKIETANAVINGSMKEKCIRVIDVGCTAEQDFQNQLYDKSDVSFARMRLSYGEVIAPGETKSYWLRVPPIHRRQPVSMGYMGHAFRDVLPGEAVPLFGQEKVEALRALDPRAAEQEVVASWERFLTAAAQFAVPDPVMKDIYLSRLATRAILEVNLNQELSYNTCSPFFYFDQSYRDGCYVSLAWDLAGLHEHAARLLRVCCKDAKDVPAGPIWFEGRPIQLGMMEDGLWKTRPGQWDTQGQNLWALVQHYKLSGDRDWLEKTAYPYIRRGAMWIVNSRHRHMAQIKDPKDARYGLIEPGAMEVAEMGKGTHMYYLNAFSVLGLREAADAAQALGKREDARLFAAEGLDLRQSLHRSFEQTFKRSGLYEGHLWFGVEPEGVGMYGLWAHNCLIWPCRCIDPHDPMMTATLRRMEWLSQNVGGGVHSDGPGNCWPYIGVDRAISYLVRGERERTLDYFCAYTDMAGGTLSWGEGYNNLIATGDQPHNWADAYWVILFRNLFAFENDGTLDLTPALFRRWHEPGQRIGVSKLPTHFGDLDLKIEPRLDGKVTEYTIRIAPKGDQSRRVLRQITLYPRIPGGRAISRVTVNGKDLKGFTRDSLILSSPTRGKELRVLVQADAW